MRTFTPEKRRQWQRDHQKKLNAEKTVAKYLESRASALSTLAKLRQQLTETRQQLSELYKAIW